MIALNAALAVAGAAAIAALLLEYGGFEGVRQRYGRVLHGEAVAMGMVYAARRSEELDLAPAGTSERLATLLERAGLPTRLPRFAREAYLSALRVDKKKQDRRIRFVVLRQIGRGATAVNFYFLEVCMRLRATGEKDQIRECCR